ncbi:hypothetical protein GE09DRAFT_158909 [Coniochaeta sp. 2T2.1]|nr:hypothetical protein GE09DRAFT_158909 [Coniochaeta sp. 2T2.1]
MGWPVALGRLTATDASQPQISRAQSLASKPTSWIAKARLKKKRESPNLTEVWQTSISSDITSCSSLCQPGKALLSTVIVVAIPGTPRLEPMCLTTKDHAFTMCGNDCRLVGPSLESNSLGFPSIESNDVSPNSPRLQCCADHSELSTSPNTHVHWRLVAVSSDGHKNRTVWYRLLGSCKVRHLDMPAVQPRMGITELGCRLRRCVLPGYNVLIELCVHFFASVLHSARPPLDISHVPSARPWARPSLVATESQQHHHVFEMGTCR